MRRSTGTTTATQNATADKHWRPALATYVALIIVIVGYPVFRLAVVEVNFEPDGTTSHWWSLWGGVFVGHWLCVLVVLAAIRSEGATLSSIGLDLGSFIRGRYFFLVLLALLLVVAYIAPVILYGDNPPDRMRSHPLGPVGPDQRVFWVFMAITAGFAEEIIYRGYALTRLRGLIGLPLAFTLALAGFIFMHGPSALIPTYFALYLISGGLFSLFFLIAKMRRLEWLILLHISLDVLLIFAP